jgi:hypothetical protein
MIITIIAAVAAVVGAGLLAARTHARPQAARIPVRVYRTKRF